MAEARAGAETRPTRSVNLPAVLVERVGKEADRRDVSVTFLVTRAVERMLPAWEAVDLGAFFMPKGDDDAA